MPDPLVPPLEPENITLGMNEATFEYLSRIWPRHERMFRVQSSLGETQYVLAHPDEVRQVLVAESRSYHKGKTFRNMKLLMGNGLIVQDGELWRRQRKLIQPLFHDRALHETGRIMRAHAEALLDHWSACAENGDPVNVTRDVSRAALKTLLEVLFSEDLPAMAAPDGKNPFELLTDESERSYQFVPRFRALLAHVSATIERRARERRSPPDFLSMLMGMPPEQLVDEVATLIVAGHETTATALAQAWHLLAFHPDVERQLHAEVDAGGDELARRVVLETLRLHPPVWILDRRAIEDVVVGGFGVPAGAELFVPVYFLQRDPRFIAEPSAFRPDRFLDPPSSSFLPFGAGPRRCIGDELALMVARIHLGTIARRLRLLATDDRLDVELVPRVNLRPKRDFYLRPAIRNRVR